MTKEQKASAEATELDEGQPVGTPIEATEEESAEFELKKLESQLEEIEGFLGQPDGVMSRLFGGKKNNVAAAQQALEQARTQIANARRREEARVAGEEEELEAERKEIEAEKKRVEKAALQVQAAAKHVEQKRALVRAKDLESMTRIDKAQTLRDDAISGHHTLRSQILGLARHFGWQSRNADELAAMRWMMENVMTKAQLKKEQVNTGTSSKLLLLGYVSELETEAKKHRENGQAGIADAFDNLAKEWAKRKKS